MKSVNNILLNEELVFSGDLGELLWLYKNAGPFEGRKVNNIMALGFFPKRETTIHNSLQATLEGFDIRYFEVQGLDPNNEPFLFSSALASENSQTLDTLRAKLLAPFEEKIGRTVHAAQNPVEMVIDFYE